MAVVDKRKNWWAERFSPRGSFAEQVTLLLQDFGLVSVMLLSAGGLDWLLRFTPFPEFGKQIIGVALLCVTVVVVALFGFELTVLCFYTVRLAIARERDSLERALRRTAASPVQIVSSVSSPSSAAKLNLALNSFRRESAEEVESSRTEIESGKFTRDVAEMPNAFETLGGAHRRFDAVSCRELSFWHTGGDSFADEYFGRCSALVGEGKIVTRIFLISREEFRQGEDLLYNVLVRHIRAGIGFAIIPYDELPPRLRRLELDFGLWDLGTAHSHFLQHGDWNRTLYIEFSMDGLNPGVAEKVKLYNEILPYIWLADDSYLSSHVDWTNNVRESWLRNSEHIGRRTGGPTQVDVPYLRIGREADLRAVVKSLFSLWRKTREVIIEDARLDELPAGSGSQSPEDGSSYLENPKQ